MTMRNVIKAEHLKTKHTPVRIILFLFPLLTIVLAVLLMRGQAIHLASYNWWYMILLPAALALFSVSIIQNDRKLGYSNLLVLPFSQGLLVLGKIILAVIYLLIANLFLFFSTDAISLFWGHKPDFLIGVTAATVLTLTYAWQIPFCFFLTKIGGSAVAFSVPLFLNVILASQPVAESKAWVIPFTIPARLMATILKLNPNGLPLEEYSLLANTSVIFPGILISLITFCLSSYIVCRLFLR